MWGGRDEEGGREGKRMGGGRERGGGGREREGWRGDRRREEKEIEF